MPSRRTFLAAASGAVGSLVAAVGGYALYDEFVLQTPGALLVRNHTTTDRSVSVRVEARDGGDPIVSESGTVAGLGKWVQPDFLTEPGRYTVVAESGGSRDTILQSIADGDRAGVILVTVDDGVELAIGSPSAADV